MSSTNEKNNNNNEQKGFGPHQLSLDEKNIQRKLRYTNRVYKKGH